jgi:hypothetical protein
MNYNYRFDVKRMADDTKDAPECWGYATMVYNSWNSVVRVLAELRFNSYEAEAILKSNLLDKASAMVKGTKLSSTVLRNYLEMNDIKPGCKLVNKLVMKEFGKSERLELNEDGVPCHRGTMPGNPGAGSILVPVGTPSCCDPTTEQYWSM